MSKYKSEVTGTRGETGTAGLLHSFARAAVGSATRRAAYTAERCSLSSGARGSEIKAPCWQGHAPSEGLGEGLFQASLLASGGYVA